MYHELNNTLVVVVNKGEKYHDVFIPFDRPSKDGRKGYVTKVLSKKIKTFPSFNKVNLLSGGPIYLGR